MEATVARGFLYGVPVPPIAFAWNEVLIGVLVGVVVTVLVALARRVWRERGRKITSIELRLSPAIGEDERLKFGLLHVRDGGVDDAGATVNKIRWFKPTAHAQGQPTNGQMTLKARTRYHRALGFQFKCFADYKGLDFSEAAELLAKENTLTNVERGAYPGRAWFLLTTYPTGQTEGGFNNNVLFPV